MNFFRSQVVASQKGGNVEGPSWWVLLVLVIASVAIPTALGMMAIAIIKGW